MAGNIKKDELSFIRVWEWDSLSSELDHSLLRVTQLLPNSWWMPLCTRHMAYTQFSLTDNNTGQSIYCYFIRFTLTTVTEFKLAFFTRVFHLDDINPRVLADVSWVPWSQAHNYIISLKPAWNSTSGSPLFYSLFFEQWSSFINHCVIKKNKKLKTKEKYFSGFKELTVKHTAQQQEQQAVYPLRANLYLICRPIVGTVLLFCLNWWCHCDISSNQED